MTTSDKDFSTKNGIDVSDSFITNSDIYLDSDAYLSMFSSDGSKYSLTVEDDGSLSTEIVWGYQKEITLSGALNAGTNYQVRLNIGESSGSSGAHFHLDNQALLFPSGKGQGGDLKFSSSNNLTLPYWVESVTGTTPNRTASVWVRVFDDLSSNATIYVYCNGPTANTSSGFETFDIFDDFDSEILNESRWVIDTGVPIFSSSEFTTTTNTHCQISTLGKSNFSSVNGRGFAARTRIRRTSATDTYFGFKNVSNNLTIQMGQTNYFSQGVYSYGPGMSQTGYGDNANGDRIYEFSLLGNQMTFNQSSGISGTRTLSLSIDNLDFYFYTGGPASGSVYSMDYINYSIVRKFVNPEPSFLSAI